MFVGVGVEEFVGVTGGVEVLVGVTVGVAGNTFILTILLIVPAGVLKMTGISYTPGSSGARPLIKLI